MLAVWTQDWQENIIHMRQNYSFWFSDFGLRPERYQHSTNRVLSVAW